MAKTKTSAGSTTEALKPYVQRAMTDPELRDDLLAAFVAARSIYGQMAQGRGLKGKAEKVSEKDFQKQLQSLVSDVTEASDRLKGEKEKSHKTRNRVILLTGVTLGVLYNPWTGPATREWIMDRIAGGNGDGFEDFAEAISEALRLPLIRWSVKSTTRAQDGLYLYDTVQRLYDSRFGDGDAKDIRRYIRLGPLGEAFAAEKRAVLLIDEVDKADLEFPNDLLHELDRMRFTILETGQEIAARERPIVVITSNNEKELPDAEIDRWRSRAHTLGRRVRVGDLEGQALDVASDGALLLRDDAGTVHRVLAGDVR